MSDTPTDPEQNPVWVRNMYKRSEPRLVEWLKSRVKEEFSESVMASLLLPYKAGQDTPNLRKVAQTLLQHFKLKDHRPFGIDDALTNIVHALEYRGKHKKLIEEYGGQVDRGHQGWIDLLVDLQHSIHMMNQLPKEPPRVTVTQVNHPVKAKPRPSHRRSYPDLEFELDTSHPPISPRVRSSRRRSADATSSIKTANARTKKKALEQKADAEKEFLEQQTELDRGVRHATLLVLPASAMAEWANEYAVSMSALIVLVLLGYIWGWLSGRFG